MSQPFVSEPFVLTVEENYAAAKAFHTPSWFDRRSTLQKVGVWLAMFFGCLLLFAVMERLKINEDLFFVAIMAFLVGLTIGVLWVGRAAKKEVARAVETVAEHPATMTLDHDGVSVKSDVSAQHVRWSVIKGIDVVDELLVLKAGDTAFICPERAMPEGVTATEVLQRAQDWKQS